MNTWPTVTPTVTLPAAWTPCPRCHLHYVTAGRPVTGATCLERTTQ